MRAGLLQGTRHGERSRLHLLFNLEVLYQQLEHFGCTEYSFAAQCSLYQCS